MGTNFNNVASQKAAKSTIHKSPSLVKVEKDLEQTLEPNNGYPNLYDVLMSRVDDLNNGVETRLQWLSDAWNSVLRRDPKSFSARMEKFSNDRRTTYSIKAIANVTKLAADSVDALTSTNSKKQKNAVNGILNEEVKVNGGDKVPVKKLITDALDQGVSIAVVSKLTMALLGVKAAVATPIFVSLIAVTAAAHMRNVPWRLSDFFKGLLKASWSKKPDLADVLKNEVTVARNEIIDSAQKATSTLAIIFAAPLLGKLLAMKIMNGFIDYYQENGLSMEEGSAKVQNFLHIAKTQGYYEAMLEVFDKREIAIMMASCVGDTGIGTLDFAINQALLMGFGVDVLDIADELTTPEVVKQKVIEAVEEEVPEDRERNFQSGVLVEHGSEGAEPEAPVVTPVPNVA